MEPVEDEGKEAPGLGGHHPGHGREQPSGDQTQAECPEPCAHPSKKWHVDSANSHQRPSTAPGTQYAPKVHYYY